MPPLLSFIRESWDFCRKQPTVMHVCLWFLFVPALASGLLEEVLQRYEPLFSLRPELKILLVIGYIALSLVIVWGMVCMLSIGKRLLQTKAGRARSSFKAARTQAGPSFIPYLLTTILRGCMLVLWALPFIAFIIGLMAAESRFPALFPENPHGVDRILPLLAIVAAIALLLPAIRYFVHTIFYPVIVVCEGIGYRPALQKSATMVRGQFGQVLATIILLALLTILPAQLLSGMFALMAKDAPPAILLAANTASAIVASFALTLNLLSMIQAYTYFQPTSAKGPVMGSVRK